MSLGWLRRRARIIAGCAVGCVVVALAIAAILPDRYSAEAVLIVPASSTDTGLGSVEEAAKLAGSYAQLIPRDTGIVEAIGASLGMAPAAVERRLSVANKPGQSLLELSFRGRTAAEAVRGARRAALAITSDNLTSESIEAASLSVVRLPRAATRTGSKPFTHVAQSVLVVPPRPALGGPGNAGEAANLATTYADLIPEDRVILDNVADTVGRSLDTVRARVSVTHDFDTSILRVSFADPDPAVALAGVKALADSVIGANPVSPRIAPRSLSLVHVPTAAVSQSMSWPKVAALGIFFGLVLGLVLALALERTHRRIDDLEMLSAEMGCAVSSLAGASEATIVALLDRWHHIAEATPARIALLPVSPASAEAASGIAERLAPERVKSRRAAGSEKSRVTRDRNVVVEVGGMPGGAAAGEQLALSADLVVLVAVEGVLAADVRKTLSVLETFGVSPSWALFAPSSEGRSRERATAHVEPDSDPVAPGGRVSSDRREPTKSRPEEPTPAVKAAPAEGPRPRARQRPARTLGTRGHDADIPARATDQG